jgi:hypothetical protein
MLLPLPNCNVPPAIIVAVFHAFVPLNFNTPTPLFVKFLPVITPLTPSFTPPPLVTFVFVVVILILPKLPAAYLVDAVIVDNILTPIELKLIAPAYPS